MKSWFLSLLAGQSLKNAVRYSVEVVSLVIDALNGVISGNAVKGDAKNVLINVVNAMTAVKDFLVKLAVILGVSIDTNVNVNDVNLSSKLDSLTDKLNDAIDVL